MKWLPSFCFVRIFFFFFLEILTCFSEGSTQFPQSLGIIGGQWVRCVCAKWWVREWEGRWLCVWGCVGVCTRAHACVCVWGEVALLNISVCFCIISLLCFLSKLFWGYGYTFILSNSIFNNSLFWLLGILSRFSVLTSLFFTLETWMRIFTRVVRPKIWGQVKATNKQKLSKQFLRHCHFETIKLSCVT